MAFSETDYLRLIEAIDAIRAKVRNPLVADAILEEVLRLHDEVPVYPGLTAAYAGRVLRQAEPDELRPTTKVTFQREGRTYTGRIAAVDDGHVLVERVQSVVEHEPLRLPANQVQIIDRGVFYHPGDGHWITLNHPSRREVEHD